MNKIKPTEKELECPKCSKKYKDELGKFAILNMNQCPECHKKWIALPENDPDNKKFYVEWKQSGTDVVYAKTEEEAEKEWEKTNYEDYEIDLVREAK